MTVATHGHWSLGTLLGFPALCLLVLVLIGLGFLFFRASRLGGLDADDYWFGIGSFVAAFAVLAITAWGMYPYSAEYHQWREVSGTVATTNSRFLSVDKGTDQKFVVVFVGAPDQQWGCSDTRCATVRPGDRLTLTCKRTFQWFGTPGYDCNFVGLEAK